MKKSFFQQTLMLFTFLLLTTVVIGFGCGDDEVETPSCNLTNADLGYDKNIKKIIDTHCIQCHGNTALGPGDYRTYDGVKKTVDSGTLSKNVVVDKTMPQGANSMSQIQRDSINCWIQASAPK